MNLVYIKYGGDKPDSMYLIPISSSGGKLIGIRTMSGSSSMISDEEILLLRRSVKSIDAMNDEEKLLWFKTNIKRFQEAFRSLSIEKINTIISYTLKEI